MVNCGSSLCGLSVLGFFFFLFFFLIRSLSIWVLWFFAMFPIQMDVDGDSDNVICIFQSQSHTVVEFVGNNNFFGNIGLWAFEQFRVFVFWLFIGFSVVRTVFGSTNLCYFWKSFVRFLFYMSNLEGWPWRGVLASTKFAKSKNSPDAFMVIRLCVSYVLEGFVLD